MITPGSANPLLFHAVDGSYQISRSLRFRSSASAYLSRTPASAGNRKTWTWSGWVKRGKLSSGQMFFEAGNTSGTTNSDLLIFQFNSADNIRIDTGASVLRVTNAVFRDPSAWYHIVILMDTTQASNNSTRIFVNSVEQTYSTTNNIPQNTDTAVNNTVAHYLGRYDGSVNFFDGYMAEVNFVDGSALTPSSFGAFDTNGVWQPAKYTGSYGTNGFYLPFSDNSALTTASNAGIGKDFSGNSNYWVTNNISITSGTTYDSMIDSPTNYADGGNGRGNYAVLNPLQSGAYVSQTNGNLTNTGNTATNSALVLATIGNLTSGKWYWEYTQGTVQSETCGIVTTYTPGTSLLNGEGIGSYGIGARATGAVYGGTVGTITSWTNGDIIGLALDCDNGAIYWSKNGTWLNSGVPTSGSSKTGAVGVWTPSSSINVTPAFGAYNGGFVSVTFGQRPFTYTPPSGFSALNTQNLPTPTIANGAQYMAAVTWSGDNTSPRSITPSSTNSGNNPLPTTFQPDMVWIKARNQAYDGLIFDSVRLAGKSIVSSSTAAEITNNGNGYLSAFNTDGFAVVQGSSSILSVNASGVTYVGWQWKAGGTGVSNTSGSITSTVSANTSAGFSVVTATAPASGSFTIGHGLGVTPGMVIVKPTAGGTANWAVWHQSLGSSYYLNLNQTAAQTSTTYWGTMTSSLISFAATNLVNASSAFVCYAFAPVAGYSAFGSFVGNNSADGPYVFLNFRPKFILIKGSTNASHWAMFDSSRDTYNVAGTDILLANSSGASITTYPEIDFLSNGFKVRATDANSYINAASQTYIYAAFAENPFRTARAR